MLSDLAAGRGTVEGLELSHEAAAAARQRTGLAITAAGVGAGRGETFAVRLRIPGIFRVLHVAWGSGFWVGVAAAVLRVDTGGGSPPVLPRDRGHDLYSGNTRAGPS